MEQWDVVPDALREKQPKLRMVMDASREDVLAYVDVQGALGPGRERHPSSA